MQRIEKSTEETGIPLLMDIPLLGYLFKRHEEKEVTTNIIVVVRPTVIRDVRTLSGLPTDLMMLEPAPPK
jgi:type II secretory pathway component GspD/PulD (secretin)